MKYSPRESTIIDVEHCLRGEIMSLSLGHDRNLLACDLLKKVNPELFDKLLDNRMRFNAAWHRPDRDMPAAKEAKREGLKLSHAAAVQIVDAHPELITPSGVTWEAHQKKIKKPTMSEVFTVTLNNSLTMSVVEHVDYNTGVITYIVKGKRLSGAVILSPHYKDGTEIIPSRVFMESGHCVDGGDREDILTINGVQLDCEQFLKLEGGQGREWKSALSRRGLFGPKSRLPDTTYDYAENVLDALATLWRKRADIADLMHAAARCNASERLENEKATTRALTAYLQTVPAALAASEKRIARYTKLQQDTKLNS
jgi:hypothetical protein